jgi:cytochrome c-type biogenesis protein CcmH
MLKRAHRLLAASKRPIQAVVLCVAMITMLGAGDSNSRYERVGHELMCACGCGQILLECNHVGCPDSARMIAELRSQIGIPAIAGDGTTPITADSPLPPLANSDKAILDWFVAKYGAIVLAAPIRGGFDNVAWITPIAIFLLATLGTAVLVRVWRSRNPSPDRIPSLDRDADADAQELRDRIRKETQY